MKLRRISAIIVLILIFGGIVGLIIGGKSNNSQTGLPVVAAENFWGNIASQLGGKYVHVTSIITDPNADPHLYESSAKDASNVADAKVVIENGVGYDDFMSKILGASSGNRQVITVANVLSVTNQGANPHLWYNIPQVPKVAAQITNSYIAKDPAHKTEYQSYLKTFDSSLQPLDNTINQIKQQYSGDPVAYTEPVPGYLLNAAGLAVKTPEGFAKSIEDGDDPSPADTAAMDALMTNKQIKILLYNSQTVDSVTQHVKALAQQNGIPVIGVTETMPANQPTYQAWQQNQLDQIVNALKTSN